MLEQGFQTFGATPRAIRSVFWLRQLSHLYERKFNEQSLVAALSVREVALVGQLQRLIQELGGAASGLVGILLHLLLACVEQFQSALVLSHEHVAHVRRQSVDEVAPVKSLFNDAVEQHHYIAHLVLKRQVNHTEIVVGIQLVEVFNHLGVCDVALAEARSLVEYRQSVAHTAVGFLGNNSQSLFLVSDAFLLRYVLQVRYGILHCHSFEVVYLAARQDGRQNLVLLGGGENKDDVCRRFLKRLEESVEGGRRQHVHLVDDENLVLAHLRRNACLLHERLDMLHRVVAGGIKLEDVVRALFGKSLAALALSACFAVLSGVHTVDGFGKDACASGLAHTARAAEQVGMGKLSALHGVLQSCSKSLLPHHRVERHRAVFAC